MLTRSRCAALIAGAAVLTMSAAACGSSGGGNVVRTGGASSASVTATPSSSHPASHVSSTSTGKTSAGTQKVTLQPAGPVASGTIVNVTATGFSANEQLTVVQCADKGTATGAGDCNIDGMVPAQTDGQGKVIARLRVLKGPFGTNAVTCSAQQKCLVSVTQATLSPTEEADAPISFLG